MPDDTTTSPKATGNKGKIGGSLAAAALAALALAVGALKHDEGKRNVSYFDISHVATACYGHTGTDVLVGQRRSDAQCEALLTHDAQAHMNGVLKCTPVIADSPELLGAATRITFNIGVAGYCRSTIARRFNAGDYRGGCDAFLMWTKANVGGRLVVVKGLVDRRQRERAMCLTGVHS